jgi:large subunit ribosomal protein L9
MKVILREDVSGLGDMGAIVDVKDGYGRNYLLPRNLAVEANSKNMKEFEHQKQIILNKAKKVIKSAEDLAAKISELTLTIEANAGEEDKLFGSVTTKDIAEAIAAKGFEVDKKKIILEEPIKRLGTYDVSIKVYQEVMATVKVDVIKADAEPVSAEAPEEATGE